MRIRNWLGAVIVFVFCAVSASLVRADSFNVTVDTSSLTGNAAGPFELGFVLIDASGSGDGNNSVTLNGFTFDGGSAGTIDPSLSEGGATGNLGSGITLTDTSFFNGMGSTFTPGNSLSFQVSMSTHPDSNTSATGLTGDQFDFLIFDHTAMPIQTTDPTGGDTLAVATIGAGGLSIQSYPIETAVPEPSSVLLLVFGLLAVLCLRHEFPSAA